MYLLRAMLIWVLALSLPVEGMAASMMTHCKDMQKATAHMSMQGMSHHDHAAMMAAMSDDSTMAHMHHSSETGKETSKTSQLGCHCGCKCGGDCALSCAAMMMPIMQSRFMLNEQGHASLASLRVAQAHAAYRYDPLRPPSAVAL